MVNQLLNTTLTITYRAGGGINHNIGAGTLRNVVTANIEIDSSGLNSALVTTSKASVGVTNPFH